MFSLCCERSGKPIIAAGETALACASSNKPRPLHQVRLALCTRHCSTKTQKAYVHWISPFVLFHHKRHPAEMGEPEIKAFLTHLAAAEKVIASTKTQALSALLFLHRHVLDRPIGKRAVD